MNYQDGEQARIGDAVELWEGYEGEVVADLDAGQFSEEYPENEWAYLKQGILVQSRDLTLFHVTEPDSSLRLLERSKA